MMKRKKIIIIGIIAIPILLFTLGSSSGLMNKLGLPDIAEQEAVIENKLNVLELVQQEQNQPMKPTGLSNDWNETCQCYNGGWHVDEKNGVLRLPNGTVLHYNATSKENKTGNPIEAISNVINKIKSVIGS
jgi:hypothetical protein